MTPITKILQEATHGLPMATCGAGELHERSDGPQNLKFEPLTWVTLWEECEVRESPHGLEF
jgi:hypothetical protein